MKPTENGSQIFVEAEIKIQAQIKEHMNISVHVTLNYHVENFPKNDQFHMQNLCRELRAGHKADEPNRNVCGFN